MKKIELLDNETFTIKGTYGETYVFDGDGLFVDSSNISRKAVVLKSLRTRAGAENWLNTMGRSIENVQIFDTETLKSFEGRIVTRKSLTADDEENEKEDFDATLPFHVVSTEGDDDEGPEQDMDDVMEDEQEEQEMSMTQIAQILHDAEKLYDMIEGEEHLEPWMQSKLAKISELIGAIAENLEHEDGDMPGEEEEEDEDDNDEYNMSDDDNDEDLPSGLPPLPPSVGGTEVKKMIDGMVKSVIKNITMKASEDKNTVKDEPESTPSDEPETTPSGSERVSGGMSEAARRTDGGDGFEKSVSGKVFKSLNAARQWNRFENPDKDRYYIDIMREKDVRKSFSKSSGLNAKYVVRDRWDEEEQVIKGAHGNKIVKGKIISEKKIDPETLRVSAIRR